MSEARQYEGGCHCGAVRYQVELALESVTECNCSSCSKRGTLLTFVPDSQFQLRKGSLATLPDYQFGKKHIHYPFCSTCGVMSFAHGKSPSGAVMVAINARCLDGVDATKLTRNFFDGAAL